MDYISPVYPLHGSDELLFQVSSTPHQKHKIHQDMLVMASSLDCSNLHFKMGKRVLHQSSVSPDNNDGASNDNYKKKILRTDIERQRRREIASLYASLRSLLPPEYLKGRQSMSDHMNEAANYVRNLQKKIQRLGDKRDGLRKLSNSSVPDVVGGNLHSCLQDCVTVWPCWVGVEVVISSGLKVGVLPLSRVLQVLVHEGFNVVSCVSTQANERSLHTLQSEVIDPTRVNLSGLQQKLTDLMESSS